MFLLFSSMAKTGDREELYHLVSPSNGSPLIGGTPFSLLLIVHREGLASSYSFIDGHQLPN